ncbi:MAG: hypothetical protein MI922_06905 [Bacteroidales bacterium]|nr:hypothetical protein [Bacteroidales bacterium]
MFKDSSSFIGVIIILFTSVVWCNAQDEIYYQPFDSVDTPIPNSADTLASDSIPLDSNVVVVDSIDVPPKKKKDEFLEDKIDYTAKDSMRLSIKGQKLYMYKEGKVTYTDIELTADYIEFDMENQEVFASGVPDSTGKMQGTPNFKQGSETFESDSMKYNFKSGKAIVYQVSTQQEDGYLHSQKTKRSDDGHVHVRGGKYTTCDAEHPHFYLALSKAIVVPDDKVLTGPAYLVVADIPTPLIIPFGFFPNTSNRASGVIIPRYGEERARGFYLSQGGWYQVLGDYADMTIQGDYYSKGSWAIHNKMSYKLRYKFSGNLGVDYAIYDDKDDPDFAKSKTFKILWSHTQDPKANPTQSFSANVNFSSSEYEKQNSYNYNEYLTTQKSSSISFRKNWPGTPFNLTLSLNGSQNNQTETANLDLPTGSFNASRIYLFRKLNKSGTKKWYDDVGFSYSAQFSNQIKDVPDSMLFEGSTYQNTNFGLSHNVPIFINFKIKKFKALNISPSLSYNGRLYNWRKEIRTEENSVGGSVTVEDTVRGLFYAHAINPSISVSLNPKMYGMYMNTREDPKLIAVRHTVSPSVSFSYVPDMRDINPNYYRDYYEVKRNTSNSTDPNYPYGDYGRGTSDVEYIPRTYSIYDGTLYGTPSSNGQSGRVSFSLSQNLEGKLKSEKDTANDSKKVPLIESLNLSTSYNPFADKKLNQRAWSDISMYGSSSLWNRKISISTRGSFTMYDYDSTGNTINEFMYKGADGGMGGKNWLRLTTIGITASFSLSSKQGKDAENMEEEEVLTPPAGLIPIGEFVPGAYYGGTYTDFDVPWSLRVNYTWSYSRANPYRFNRTHTVGVSGDLSLTPKWKIGGNTNYDIEREEFSFTNINISRDLHCWEMKFTMVPFGPRRSYMFTINARSSILSDLKIEKRHSWRDNF